MSTYLSSWRTSYQKYRQLYLIAGILLIATLATQPGANNLLYCQSVKAACTGNTSTFYSYNPRHMSADATVVSTAPTNNYGSTAIIEIGNEDTLPYIDGNNEKYGLALLPNNLPTNVRAVLLHVPIVRSGAEAPVGSTFTFSAQPNTTGPFDSGTVNWNNKPDVMVDNETLTIATADIPDPGNARYVAVFDITRFVKYGQATNGFRLSGYASTIAGAGTSYEVEVDSVEGANQRMYVTWIIDIDETPFYSPYPATPTPSYSPISDPGISPTPTPSSSFTPTPTPTPTPTSSPTNTGTPGF